LSSQYVYFAKLQLIADRPGNMDIHVELDGHLQKALCTQAKAKW